MAPESQREVSASGSVKRAAHSPQRPWEAAFLRAYALHGIVLEGCKYARIDRGTVYKRRAADPEFAKAMEAAFETAADALELAVMKRAASQKAPDTTAAIFMLKGMRPEKYRERFEHSGRIDGANVATPEARDARLVELIATALARKSDGSAPTEPGS